MVLKGFGNFLSQELFENSNKNELLKKIHREKENNLNLQLQTHIFESFSNFLVEKFVEKSHSKCAQN